MARTVKAMVPPRGVFMANATLNDRRSSERFNPVQAMSVFFPFEENTHGVVSSFSLNGLKLKSNKNPPTRSGLTLRLSYPNENPVTLDVRVVWNRKLSNETPHFEFGCAVLDRKDAPSYRLLVDRLTKDVPFPRRTLKERRQIAAKTGQDNRAGNRRGRMNVVSRTYAKNFGLDRWGAYYAYARVIDSSSGGTVETNNGKVLMLGSNNYLGLTHHPKVQEAAMGAIKRYGTGAGGARVLSGNTTLHQRLEEKIAEFKGTEAALLFPTGYVTNFSVLSALLEPGDVVFNDQLNHASIIDGCRMTKGIVRFYHHNDMVSLEKKLKQYPFEQSKIIITDGVFSMDGDIAPLDVIVALGKKHNAVVMLDDAHAIGVLGKTGRGTAEHFGVTGKVDITIATFSKSLGSMAGAVCGSKSLIKHLSHHSRQFIFSTAVSPVVCATALAAIEVLETEPQWIEKLHRNRRFLVDGLKSIGFNALDVETAIIPILIGNERMTYALTHALYDSGVFVNAVSRPSVPRELSRIRISPMAIHTEEELGRAVAAFKTAGKRLGLI
ncbi:MAG: aminotransferase class I/II-fold pyridoxal phosphate-dependent enzyme [Elusimicrobia bacterium]|nr:aminotransferase class I/II-fold pyridoxal phosphate-dependent enzyme [Elusimicrobiota bacterium]